MAGGGNRLRAMHRRASHEDATRSEFNQKPMFSVSAKGRLIKIFLSARRYLRLLPERLRSETTYLPI